MREARLPAAPSRTRRLYRQAKAIHGRSSERAGRRCIEAGKTKPPANCTQMPARASSGRPAEASGAFRPLRSACKRIVVAGNLARNVRRTLCCLQKKEKSNGFHQTTRGKALEATVLWFRRSAKVDEQNSNDLCSDEIQAKCIARLNRKEEKGKKPMSYVIAEARACVIWAISSALVSGFVMPRLMITTTNGCGP